MDGQLFSGHIIAILAAILFPVFARAREKARQTSCLSNLKQLGLGMLMYAQDYDEMLPAVRRDNPTDQTYRWPGGSSNYRRTWAPSIYPYIVNIQIYNCPSTSRRWDGNWRHPTPEYGYNEHISSRTLGEITRPAETLVLVDSTANPDYGTSGGYGWRVQETYRGQDVSTGYLDNRHNGGVNLVLVDGHAKWVQCPYWGDIAAGTPWNLGGVRWRP